MAQLYFYYSAMNAGKSTYLLQSAYNYEERGMQCLIYTAAIDNRFEEGKVTSRVGLSADAFTYDKDFDFVEHFKSQHQQTPVNCVLIDEAQFLSADQVKQISDIVDDFHCPVLAFGLRTDFKANTFSGSERLLAWADKLIELKTICHCGKKANFVARVDEQGQALHDGSQIEIGGNERYVSLCRKHYKDIMF